MTRRPPLVRSTDVSKRFVLHKDKSLKERIVNFGRRAGTATTSGRSVTSTSTSTLGSTVGLVGHNGSGKSTLLKVIGGILQPTTGHRARRGRLAALLELGAGFHPDLTGRENVYLNAAILGLTRKQRPTRQFDDIVDFSGHRGLHRHPGQVLQLGHVRAARVRGRRARRPRPAARRRGARGRRRAVPAQVHGEDRQFQHEGRTIVLVSHSADQVGSLCDRVVVLNGGNIVHDGDTGRGLRDPPRPATRRSGGRAGRHPIGEHRYSPTRSPRSTCRLASARRSTTRSSSRPRRRGQRPDSGLGRRFLDREHPRPAPLQRDDLRTWPNLLPNTRRSHTPHASRSPTSDSVPASTW